MAVTDTIAVTDTVGGDGLTAVTDRMAVTNILVLPQANNGE